MMILNKQEAVLLIDDLAAMAAVNENAMHLFDTVAERGAFLMGVAHLKAEFVKRIDDYV